MKKPGLKQALAASTALNLLLAGAFLGMTVTPDKEILLFQPGAGQLSVMTPLRLGRLDENHQELFIQAQLQNVIQHRYTVLRGETPESLQERLLGDHGLFGALVTEEVRRAHTEEIENLGDALPRAGFAREVEIQSLLPVPNPYQENVYRVLYSTRDQGTGAGAGRVQWGATLAIEPAPKEQWTYLNPFGIQIHRLENVRMDSVSPALNEIQKEIEGIAQKGQQM